MGSLLIAVIYLISSRFAAWLGLADHAGVLWRAVIVCGICLNDNIIYDNHIGTHEPEAYKQDTYEMDCDMFDSAHNFRAVWIFT